MTADSSTEIPDRGRRLRCGHPLHHGTGVAGHPWARHLTRTIPPIWAAILVVVAGVWNALVVAGSGRPVDDQGHGGVLGEVGHNGDGVEDLVEPEPLR